MQKIMRQQLYCFGGGIIWNMRMEGILKEGIYKETHFCRQIEINK